MPIIVPPFVQYQAPLVPLRGLWNAVPVEGDRFVSCEIQWGLTTGDTNAVQFSFSGNSPVTLSQIVALNVDNSRNGADVQFLFPDSGSVLVVPGYNQGLYPIFTNALMFYVSAMNASVGDLTIFQVFNSIPPTVTVQASDQQSFAGVAGIDLSLDNTVQIVPGNGTLESFQIVATGVPGDTAQTVEIELSDGAGRVVWIGIIVFAANSPLSIPVQVTGLRQRFVNGLQMTVTGGDLSGGIAVFNVYYSTP